VIAIAYGSETTGCSTDGSTLTTTSGSLTTKPCNTMLGMASTPYSFYTDPNQSGTGVDTTCVSTENPGLTSIQAIFFNIFYENFGVSRLVNNSAT
jgi:hypothetical protein